MQILLVEDEKAHAELVCRSFDEASETGQVRLALVGSIAEARTWLAESTPDLVIANWDLPDGEGLELLLEAGEMRPYPVVMMTSHGNERVAVEAIKAGALDYVAKSAEELARMPRVAERALREWGHIVERRRVEEALSVSERRFRALIEQSPIGTIVYRPDGSLRYGNPAGIKLWGVSEEAYQTLLLGYNVLEDEQLAAIGSMDFIRRGFSGEATGVPPIAYQFESRTGDQVEQQVMWVEGFVYPIKDEEGQVQEVVVIHTDISARMQTEMELQKSLREKEVLVREIHHRVKNNLQVVSSLLQLQAESVEDVQVHRLLDESRSRIRAMGLVHERLYNAQDVAGLCAAEYLHDLVDQLVSIYSGSTPTVFPQIQVDDIVLDIDTAIPCGLILTELVSNSLHHAFAPEGGKEASLRIELLEGEDRWLTLVVADSGLGLPADLDWRHSESLGLQLVSLLVDQMQGTIELDRSAGTAFKISFPTTRQ